MGIVQDTWDAIRGKDASDAAEDAANIQAQVGREAIDFQRESRDRLIDLQDPFREFGQGLMGSLENRLSRGVGRRSRGDIMQARALAGRTDNRLTNRARQLAGRRNPALNRLTALTTDPNAQADFISNNPFFESLAGRAKEDLFANQAARGKLGSGETAEELQNRLVGIGSDLLNREVGQLQGAAGTASQIGSSDISNLLGISGVESGQRNQQISNLLGISGFETGLEQQNISNLFGGVGLGQNAAALQGNAIQGSGNQITDLMTGIGNARAAGMIGAANAGQQGFNNLLNLGGLAAFASDRRLKEDIAPDGEVVTDKATYPVYTFRYKGHKERFRGVMADEVKKVNPEAVIPKNGFDYVDYARL